MLAATQRLRRSTDFAAAIRGGRRVGRGAVVVHLRTAPTHDHSDAPTTDLHRTATPQPGTVSSAEPALAGSPYSPARAGFVVSKAVGNAVVRNQVRRRLRHLVRDRIGALPPGALLVVRALPAAAGASSAVLAADLDAAVAAAAARVARSGRKNGNGAR